MEIQFPKNLSTKIKYDMLVLISLIRICLIFRRCFKGFVVVVSNMNHIFSNFNIIETNYGKVNIVIVLQNIVNNLNLCTTVENELRVPYN